MDEKVTFITAEELQGINSDQPEQMSAGPTEESIAKRKPRKKNTDFLKSELHKKERDEIKKNLKTFLPIIEQAKARNANEADTANIVHKLFQDVLGWDFLDLTSEYKIKSTYCDLAIKYQGDIHLLIEVKAIGLNLKEEHSRQASNYAAHEGVKFTLLTNGETFRLYNVDLDDKIVVTEVFEFTLTHTPSLDDLTELYLLSKYSLLKEQISDYWTREETLSAVNLYKALLSEECLSALSKSLRIEHGIKIDTEVIKARLEGILNRI